MCTLVMWTIPSSSKKIIEIIGRSVCSFRIVAAPPSNDALPYVRLKCLYRAAHEICLKVHFGKSAREGKQVAPGTDQCPPQPCFPCVFIFRILFPHAHDMCVYSILVLHALCVTAAATLRFTGRKAGRLTAKHHWAAAQLKF